MENKVIDIKNIIQISSTITISQYFADMSIIKENENKNCDIQFFELEELFISFPENPKKLSDQPQNPPQIFVQEKIEIQQNVIVQANQMEIIKFISPPIITNTLENELKHQSKSTKKIQEVSSNSNYSSKSISSSHKKEDLYIKIKKKEEELNKHLESGKIKEKELLELKKLGLNKNLIMEMHKLEGVSYQPVKKQYQIVTQEENYYFKSNKKNLEPEIVKVKQPSPKRSIVDDFEDTYNDIWYIKNTNKVSSPNSYLKVNFDEDKSVKAKNKQIEIINAEKKNGDKLEELKSENALTRPNDFELYDKNGKEKSIYFPTQSYKPDLNTYFQAKGIFLIKGYHNSVELDNEHKLITNFRNLGNNIETLPPHVGPIRFSERDTDLQNVITNVNEKFNLKALNLENSYYEIKNELSQLLP